MAHPNAPTRPGVIAAISGFRPMMTGPICDACSKQLTDGDSVFVYLDHDGTKWYAWRTHCCEDPDELEVREYGGPNAIVECEIGYSPKPDRCFPLYNPEVRVFFGGERITP